jgi:hypothetical protein
MFGLSAFVPVKDGRALFGRNFDFFTGMGFLPEIAVMLLGN